MMTMNRNQTAAYLRHGINPFVVLRSDIALYGNALGNGIIPCVRHQAAAYLSQSLVWFDQLIGGLGLGLETIGTKDAAVFDGNELASETVGCLSQHQKLRRKGRT